ncbi:hypothetical protein SLE2022_349670 [Rubroshorea leprosula]
MQAFSSSNEANVNSMFVSESFNSCFPLEMSLHSLTPFSEGRAVELILAIKRNRSSAVLVGTQLLTFEIELLRSWESSFFL